MVNWLQLASTQYKTGSITDKNKKKLTDLTNANIASAWDKQAWLDATRNMLSWKQTIQSPTKPPVINNPVDTGSLEWAKWYDASQVWIPWVNLIKKPPIVGASTEKKVDETITSGTKDIWTTGINWGTWEVTPWDNTSFKDFDANKDWMINESELSWDYKTFYDWLSDTEKKAFLATWQNALKNNLDIAESYAKYMRDYDTTKTRTQQDEDYRLKQAEISGDYSAIQESQTLRKAKAWVDKLKQSIAYLWSQWMPGVSWQRLVSLDWQIKEAEKTYAETVKLYELADASRKLWDEKSAQNFERQMSDLTTKLNDNVDKSIQDAFNTLVQADNNWQLDTVPELEAFRNKMFQDLDSSITWFTDASIEQLNFLIKRQDVALTEAKTFQNNKNTINKDMSVAQWYYVDWNWSPVISSTTGQTIKIPKTSPIDPIFDKASGKLITFTTDETWWIVANVDQVIDQPVFEQTAISSFANLVAQWKIKFEDVPESVRNTDTFLSWLESAKKESTTQDWSKLDDKTLYNQKTWEIKDIATWDVTSSVVSDTKSIINYSTTKRWRTNLQCWELVNDYWTQTTGSKAWMWDTLESKVDALESVWFSDIPVAWWLFVSNPLWNDVWHTWIIQKVNSDWSIEVLEANAQGLENWQKPVTKIYTADQLKNQAMAFSNAPPQKEKTLMEDVDLRVWRLGANVYGKTVSDKESERIERILKNNPNANDNDIIDAILWFTIKPEYKDVSNKLRDLLFQYPDIDPKVNLAPLWRLINNWKIPEAVNQVEQLVYNDKKKNDPDGFISERITKTTVRKSDELLKLVSQLETLKEWKKNPIWTGWWTIEEWLWRFKSPEATLIKNKAAQLVQEFRKNNLGSAVTPSEEKFLESVIPQLFDSTQNFKIKVSEFQNNSLGLLNDFRWYNLPKLDKESLTDLSKRAELYKPQTDTIDINTKNLWTTWTWLWAALWFGKTPVVQSNLDEVDQWFFNQTWAWQLDQTDLDFFNNL